MHKFTSEHALGYAREGRIEAWVHEFLLSEGKNKELSDGLRKAPRHWEGPIMLPLSKLKQIGGPDADKEYIMEAEGWEKKTSSIAAAIRDGTDLPPLIAEHRDGILSLRDGNHRYCALGKAGKHEYWTIIWYNEAP